MEFAKVSLGHVAWVLKTHIICRFLLGGAQCVCQRHVAMEVVSLSEENMACSKLEAEWGVYRGATATFCAAKHA